MKARAEIEQHLKDLDGRIGELVRRGRVEGWDSYTSLMKAKSEALIALATVEAAEQRTNHVMLKNDVPKR
ncbi:hypothetical protein JQN58_04905 [Aneurinibacillus sp. BA2021]|nr:hypothetical protein [Aneurinibacillus sp. BA2021]